MLKKPALALLNVKNVTLEYNKLNTYSIDLISKLVSYFNILRIKNVGINRTFFTQLTATQFFNQA